MRKVTYKNENWSELDEVFCPRCSPSRNMWKIDNMDFYICPYCNRAYTGRLVDMGLREKAVVSLIREEMGKKS